MNFVLASIFRNSSSYVDRYIRQASLLRDAINKLHPQNTHSLRLVLTEGDSTDDTYDLLDLAAAGKGFSYDLEQVNHGGPSFGSVDNKTRWRNISRVCNATLDRIQPSDDIVIYVESDLLWSPDVMTSLIRHLWQVNAVAPMCFHATTGLFYDTWGFRKNGKQFQPKPPYHLDVQDILTPIDSAGSCIVMRGEVARKARFTPPEFGIVGFGYDMNAQGYQLWLDPNQLVIHP
jgi:hypothetical protein